MTTLAITGDTAVANTVTKVTSALATDARVHLPEVGGGAGQLAEGVSIAVVNSGPGRLTLLNRYGAFVAYVPSKAEGYAEADARGTYSFVPATAAFAPSAAIADAVVNHTVNATFSNVEVKGHLDALGVKINAVLAALRNAAPILNT